MATYSVRARQQIDGIYKLYPRKLGKTRGINSALAQCKSDNDLELLKKAIANYSAHIAREGTEPQYIMYFSTFMGQWKDWIDPETGSAKMPTIDLSEAGFES